MQISWAIHNFILELELNSWRPKIQGQVIHNQQHKFCVFLGGTWSPKHCDPCALVTWQMLKLILIEMYPKFHN
jgi:hypothetical protein